MIDRIEFRKRERKNALKEAEVREGTMGRDI